MNLILDIGNTVSKYYFFDGDMLDSHGRQPGHTLEFIDNLPELPEAAIVSSVVDLSEEAERRLQALPCPVERFTTTTPIPLVNRYRTPSTLGTDRLAAAIGAWTQHPHHPLLSHEPPSLHRELRGH